ncbi:MAG: 50S ribosomal protein L29 [Candidatus Zixiibacteriota bacterium]
MKLRELRELTKPELLQHKRDLEEELFNLRMRKSIKSLDNPLRTRQIDREIGRVLTILREDELGIRVLAESKKSLLADAKTPKQGKGE